MHETPGTQAALHASAHTRRKSLITPIAVKDERNDLARSPLHALGVLVLPLEQIGLIRACDWLGRAGGPTEACGLGAGLAAG